MTQVWRTQAHSSSLWVGGAWRCALLLCTASTSQEAGGSYAKRKLLWDVQDDARVLRDCGITPSTRILVLGGQSAAQRAELAAQDDSAKEREERQERLTRLRQAAVALAKRSGAGWGQCAPCLHEHPPPIGTYPWHADGADWLIARAVLTSLGQCLMLMMVQTQGQTHPSQPWRLDECSYASLI